MIEIRIQFDPTTGQFGVSGPLDNKLIMYAAAELLKDAVRAEADKKASESRIVPASVIPFPS